MTSVRKQKLSINRLESNIKYLKPGDEVVIKETAFYILSKYSN